MNYQECAPDPEPTPEQAALIAGLTDREKGDIDRCILSCVNERWKKVARVAAESIQQTPIPVRGLPDVYYALRVYALVESEVLEHQGFLGRMRYCEVRKVQ